MKIICLLLSFCVALSAADIYSDVKNGYCYEAAYNFVGVEPASNVTALITCGNAPVYLNAVLSVDGSGGYAVCNIKLAKDVDFTNSAIASNTYVAGSLSNQQVSGVFDLQNANLAPVISQSQPAYTAYQGGVRETFLMVSNVGNITKNIAFFGTVGNKVFKMETPILLYPKKTYFLMVSNSAAAATNISGTLIVQIRK
jgi:hypothetical protein